MTYTVSSGTLNPTQLSICESSFDLQFSLSDISDDENAVSVKDKASNERYLYHPSPRYVSL